VRGAYCGGVGDGDYLKSLATAAPWNAQGGAFVLKLLNLLKL
jgi:hypothetical protein